MILSPGILQAGEGGFIWRDESILEAVKDDRKAAKTAFKRRAFTSAVPIIASILVIGFGTHFIAALVTLVLIGLFSFAKWGKGRGWEGVPYLLPGLLAAIVVHGFGPYLLWAGIGALVVFLFARGEARTLGLILVSATPSIPSPVYQIITCVLVALICGYAYKRNSSVIRLHYPRSKGRADMPYLPIGYYRLGREVLRKSLRSNNDDISSKHRGSVAERETALALKKLPAGSIVYHDIPLPGADLANLDHLVLSNRGVFIIDSKLFAGRIEKNEEGEVVKVTDKTTPLKSVGQQMRWARKAISAYAPENSVRVIVAVQNATIDGMVVDEDKKQGSIAYLPLDSCVETILRFPERFSANEVEGIQQRLDPVVANRKAVYPKSGLNRMLRLKGLRA